MAGNQHVAGFAKVHGGWTGTIKTTISSTHAVVTPSSLHKGRESAASVMAALVKKSEDTHGGTWSVDVDTAGKITIRSSLSFSLTATDNTATRTGFGTESAALENTTGAAAPNGVYPLALDFRGLAQQKNTTTFAADGTGAPPTVWAGSQGTATILDTWANTHTFAATLFPEGTLFVADIWVDGYVLGRFAITNVTSVPAGQKPSHWRRTVNIRSQE